MSGLVEKLKNAYKDLTPGSTIAQQTRSIVAQSEEILNAWVDVATDAVVNYNLQDGQNNNTPGEVRLSERERSNAKSLVEQIRENISDINEIGSVATITGKEIRKDIRPTDAAMEFVKTFGGTIMRDGFGEVRFSKGKVKSGLVGHGMGVAKLDTFAAVPDVIRKGVQIGFAENWKGRQKDSFIFAAPVTYLGETAYVGVIVERDIQSNMYYVHEVVDSEGNVFAWSNKKEEPTSDRLLAANGSLDTVVDSSANSISSKSQNVNPEDTLYSSRNVQQTKNLVALHNITEDKFLKTLELGGFPTPAPSGYPLPRARAF